MAQKAPGKHFRKGMSLIEIMDLFPDDHAAERWFTEIRWPDGPSCHYCGSSNVQSGTKHKTMPYRCREKECGKRFSVRTGTVMQASNLPYRTWAVAIYLLLTSLKSVSSMKLHRDLDITQRSAWHLAHRIRKSFETNGGLFAGPVEVDESYFGGRRANMPKAKRKKMSGRGTAGKTAVVGAKDRASGRVSAVVVPSTDTKTLQSFVSENAAPGATVYTDEAAAYQGIPFAHEAVRHSVGEYVRDMVHTNGIESFWSLLKRAHKGTFHQISPEHLNRYVQEFAGRHNMRNLDTLDQMAIVAKGMDRKRLRYRDLIA